MRKISIKKGHRFQIEGRPSKDLTVLADSSEFAVLPERIPFIKPRLKVAEGDAVRIGSLLFEDKRNPKFKFLSPAGGRISRIQFGPRRVIQAIVIGKDRETEKRIDFSNYSLEQIAAMDRMELISLILEGGLWWLFRALPYRDVPDPAVKPPLILVSLGNKEPFQPSADIYLANQLELFAYGLKVLNRLCDDNVLVLADEDNKLLLDMCGHQVTHSIRGNYPAHDAGTVLYHVKTSQPQNRSWYTTGQDVLLLAQFLAQGRYPTERIVTVGGSATSTGRQHYLTRMGVPLAHLTENLALQPQTRYVVGGLMRGYKSDHDGFMGLRETSLTLVPEGAEAEFLSLFKPGFKKPTFSSAFFSKFNSGQMAYDCNLHGGRRACIACMHCADVCPVDILPQMTYKAILAEEVEEYLEHGLLDCVSCGLCSYVCPSKIELSQTFIKAKAAYAKEQLSFTHLPEDDL